MSRAIDRLPPPSITRETKVIVIARSRTGTLSLYHALRILGYKTYHGAEVMAHGTSHLEIFEEALKAKHFGIGKPYGKAEFDKWFAEYDAIVELPAVFLEEMIEAYPEATFIHVERDLDKWYKSIMSTLGHSLVACEQYPLKQLRWVDSYIDKFCSFHLTVQRVWWHGMPIDQGEAALKGDYTDLNRRVKQLLPPEKLNSFSLEDGFGWEEMCGVLGLPIPAVEYPRKNTPARFDEMQEGFLSKAIRRAKRRVATLGLVSMVIPSVAVGAFYYQRYVRGRSR